MTPGARVAAAIEILDAIAGGLAAEQALTRWARASRFAGSKDRAAVRDHVFDVLRRRRTAAHYGRGETGRSLMIGALVEAGADPNQLFTGEGHAPAPPSAAEREMPAAPTDRPILWNLPDWLLPHIESSLGDRAEVTARALQDRAPVFLRVNKAKTNRSGAQKMLHDAGIETVENPLSGTALTVIEGARRIRNSNAFSEGYVELQDASSQTVVDLLPPGERVLDYCAGGGGKSLAIAAQPDRTVFAHDSNPGRMRDLPLRAARAGVRIPQLAKGALAGAGPFEIVLCDAPCSGSGAWRRAPEGKWRLTPEALEDLIALQDSILAQAARLVAPGGTLAYATCSLFRIENEARVQAFLESNPGWQVTLEERFDVGNSGDGFFTAHLTRV
ncbi:MAG: RsmB/NOP family class I SAM-dependent RNA methyltransferase [Sulfitobacter sp.]|nr:RsmB/NOP family class I SAM-dependent RNA methyltransferase [Sulfitobacter sp.]